MTSQEPQQDDITSATYTARSYPLATGEPADPHEARIDAALAGVNLPAVGGNPHVAHRDLSLEGAGTGGAGAGYVDPADLKAQMEHPRDPEVDNATYVSRSQYIGKSPDHSHGVPNPSVRPSAIHTDTSPHIPGEFPSELGEDEPSATDSTKQTAGIAGGVAALEKPEQTSSQTPITTTTLSLPSKSNDQSTVTSPPIVNLPDTTTSVSSNADLQSSESAKNHYGRDAALAGGAGAAAVGAYELTKDKSASTGPASGTVGPHESNVANIVDPRVKPDVEKPSTTVGPHESDLANKLDPRVTSNPQKAAEKEGEKIEEFHSGRNAAVATGAGAAGVAAYELSKDKKDEKAPVPESTAPHSDKLGTTASAPIKQEPETVKQTTTVGPHDSDLANKLDPRVASDPDKASTKKAEKEEKESHHGRDAALVGGAGAAGVGAYELSKDSSTDTGPASKTIGPHESNIANIVDPRVKPDPEKMKGSDTVGPHDSALANKLDPRVTSDPQKAAEKEQKKEESHKGRDIAAVGAAGVAGAGAYEYAQDRSKDTGPASKTIGPHESNIANVVDPRVKPDPEKMKGSETVGPHDSALANKLDPRVTSDPQKAAEKKHEKEVATEKKEKSKDESHKERDAAAVGAAGVVGAGAYEYAQDGSRDSGPASKTIGPHKSNIANILDPRVKPDPALMKEKEPITSGPHRSDLANIADPRVRSDPARPGDAGAEEKQYGRDAAVAGGVGAVGAGAYEASKDHPKQGKPAATPESDEKKSHGLFGSHKHDDTAPKQKEASDEKKKSHGIFGSRKQEELASHEPEPETEKKKSHGIFGSREHEDKAAALPQHHSQPTSIEEHSNNKVSVDERGHHKLHKKAVDQSPRTSVDKYERTPSDSHSRDVESEKSGEQGDKKHGFLHKILHPREHKREKQEAEANRQRSSLDHPLIDESQFHEESVDNVTGPAGTLGAGSATKAT